MFSACIVSLSFFRGSILKCIMSKFWLRNLCLGLFKWCRYWWYKFFCPAAVVCSYEELLGNRRLSWGFWVLACLRMDWARQAVLQKLGEIQRWLVRKTKGKTLSWRDAQSVCVKEKTGSRVGLKSAWIRKSSQNPVYKNILRSVRVKQIHLTQRRTAVSQRGMFIYRNSIFIQPLSWRSSVVSSALTQKLSVR